MSPTAGAMNMSGIIDMRNFPHSFTALSLMMPVHSAVKSIAIPYMLAGIGSGMRLLRISPIKDIATIMANCFMYFIALLFSSCKITT